MKIKIKEILPKTRQLLLEHHEPKEIALGVAIGVLIGCSPLYGFHSLLAILVALMMQKANRLAILAGTQISLPFFAPVIYWAEYKIGKAILFWDALMPQAGQDRLMEVNHIGLGLLALLVGSIIVGLAFAAAAYFATLYAAMRIKSKEAALVILLSQKHAANKLGQELSPERQKN